VFESCTETVGLTTNYTETVVGSIETCMAMKETVRAL
jgi:hypothetical protein